MILSIIYHGKLIDKVNTLSVILLIYFFSTLMLGFSSTALADSQASPEPFTMTWSRQPSSLEPNGSDFLIANHALASHIFDPLFNLDENGNPNPVLIKSFLVESPTQWLFTLKSGVKFHDGSELTSADVIATFDRINSKEVSNPYRKLLSDLQYQAVNSSQFRIITDVPNPDLPGRLVLFFIIKKSAEKATREQFNNQNFAIGTGPYQLVSQQNLTTFTFKAFESYHRKPAYLKQVNITVTLSDEERIQDFLAGKTDFIDGVTPLVARKIVAKRNANITKVADDLLYLLYMDFYNDQSPDIRDHNGHPMPRNPLKDRNVRLAISLAIDRAALIEKIFGNNQGATATGQLVPPWSPGSNNRILTPIQDIQKAKQLLTRAGYPNGFQVDLYERDTHLTWLTALAEMLAQVGIQATVKTLPFEQYYQKVTSYTLSIPVVFEKMASIRGALNNNIISSSPTNKGRYTNPKIDQLILAANQQFNDTRRIREYRYITELVMEDQAMIPLFFTNLLWLTRPDVIFVPAGERLMEAYAIQATNHK